MNRLDELRKKIDEIDQELMKLIDERYRLTKDVGIIKAKLAVPVTNNSREEEILNKASNYLYSDEIVSLYKEMFLLNKNYQGFKYGLIAKDISYSFSPLVYYFMGLDNYKLIKSNDFNKTINKLVYNGLNVTNPYKNDAFKYCTSHDDSAIITNSVNLIIDTKGYNTDYLALKEIFKENDLYSKKVLIIGNGATANSVYMALNKNAKKIVRTIKEENEDLISNYKNYLDYDCIINTTPYGTSPNYQFEPLFSLEEFTKLKLVIDVVYNPICTPLIAEAKKYNIKTISGVNLLVGQAAINYNLWFNKQINKDVVLSKVKKHLYNVVLIGMSFSGKTTLGEKLSKDLNKDYIDIDHELAKENLSLSEVLKKGDLKTFRKHEESYTINYAKKFNQVISTGGGIILNDFAMENLKLNGIIVYLETSIETIKQRMDNSRPLLQNIDDLNRMFIDRIDKYEKYSMIILHENMKYEEILVKINEAISN